MTAYEVRISDWSSDVCSSDLKSQWGTGTILLVEDEDMVRAVAERALTRAGYSVVTASQGEEGLERFAGMEKIDLIVSDVVMPTMDGRSEEHTSELQSLMRISYAVFCLKKNKKNNEQHTINTLNST